MAKPWDKRGQETGKAYTAFLAYLSLGLKRSLPATAEKLQRPPRYLSTLKGWSARYGWTSRAAAYDREQLDRDIAARREAQERARQRFVDDADIYAETIRELAEGRPGDTALEFRDSYANPIVKPSTRLQAAIHGLALAGVDRPKRVELSGPDGDAIEHKVQHEIDALSDEEFERLRATVLGDPENGETRKPT